MAKKRVTIYIEEGTWKDIKRTALELDKSASEYLIGLHLKTIRLQGYKEFQPDKHKSHRPKMDEKSKAMDDALGRIPNKEQIIEETQSKIDKIVKEPKKKSKGKEIVGHISGQPVYR